MPFVSEAQRRLCWSLGGRTGWDCRAFAGHAPAPKAKGPEPVKTAPTPAEKAAADLEFRAFAADFLTKCAAAGITDPATVLAAARQANRFVKSAFIGSETAATGLGGVGGALALAPVLGSIGIPMIGGGLLGMAAGSAKNQMDTDDTATLRTAAQANAYRRRAAAAAADAQVRKLIATDPSKYVRLS